MQRILLYREVNTLLPTTDALYWTLHRSGVVECNWTIVKGSDTNPDVIIYKLNPEEIKT